MASNTCARCNWSWWKHKGPKNHCPYTPRNPNGSKPRFERRRSK